MIKTTRIVCLCILGAVGMLLVVYQSTLFYLGYKNVTRAAHHRFVCEWAGAHGVVVRGGLVAEKDERKMRPI